MWKIIVSIICLYITHSVNVQILLDSVLNKSSKKTFLCTDITKSDNSVKIRLDSSEKFIFYNASVNYFDSPSILNEGCKIFTIYYRNKSHLIDSQENNHQEKFTPISKDTNQKKQVYKLGSINNSENGIFGGAMASNLEGSLLIRNSLRTPLKIQKVGFYILKEGKYKAPFRIRIYQTTNEEPGKELTTDKILVNGYRGNAWNIFDISKYNLYMPVEGCFISMEWISNGLDKYKYKMAKEGEDYGYGQTIGLTDEYTEPISFIRVKEGKWITWEKFCGIELDWTKGNLFSPRYNPMMRLYYIN